MRTVKASKVKVGDTIQHPKRYWTPRKVLAVKPTKDPRMVRFELAGMTPNHPATGTFYPVNADVLLH